MVKNIFVIDQSDDLTTKICKRLGERQEKINQMAAWEDKISHRKVRPIYYLTAITAGILAIVLLWPAQSLSPIDELGIEAPTRTLFRDASPEMVQIEKMIKEKQWGEALLLVDKLLKASDLAIYELESVPEIWTDEEEMAYEDQQERLKNSELRWTYIYLLVKYNKLKLARKEIKKYLKNTEFCEHEHEARQLMKRLK